MIRESLLALTLITGANVADGITTYQAMGPTTVEVNGVYGPHAERLIPVKALVITLEFGVYHEIRKKNKKLAWVYVSVIVGANLLVAYHNNAVGRN